MKTGTVFTHFRVLLIVTMFLLLGSVAAEATTMNPRYLSPKNGSMLVSRQTTIIVRPGDSLNRKSVVPTLFTVTGSISKIHTGRVNLSDDQRTICFKVDFPFTPSEKVTVSIKDGLLSKTGKLQGSLSFTFRIAADNGQIREFARTASGTGDDFASPYTHASWPVDQFLASDSLPSDFPAVNVLTNDHPTDGRLFLASFEASYFPTTTVPYLLILNNDGSPFFYRRMPDWPTDFHPQANGQLTYFDRSARKYFAMDSSYSVVDSFECQDGYTTDLHDIQLLPNGHVLMIGTDSQRVDMGQQILGGSPQAEVIGAIIQELDQSRNVVFQWRSWDHYVVTDAIYEDMLAASIDYVHANAIQMDTDGNILLSARNLSEITKINRETGEIMWRLGGKHNEFTFVNDTVGFNYQHAARRIANGNITLFDNGNNQVPKFSRAAEYHLDVNAKTATLVWQFRHSPDVVTGAMGYVQRLQNGNTLIGWGLHQGLSVSEVRPDGSTAYEMALGQPNSSYRAYRFPWNPTTAAVKPSASEPLSFSLEQNYPNPFTASTNIHFHLAQTEQVELHVVDVLGREVTTLAQGRYTEGEHIANFVANGLPAGIYYVKLTAGGTTLTKPMALVK
jgi:hypothetical protein